jgi:hypothetical protein
MASVVLRLVLISVPIAGVLLYFGTAGSGPRPSEDGNEPRSAAPAVDAAPSVPPAASSEPAGPAAVRAAGPLSVALSATRPSWVAAVVDGRQAVARQFQAGERQVFEARREIELTFSDPSAITMTVNGVNARPLGAAGTAVTRLLTPGNVHQYLEAP